MSFNAEYVHVPKNKIRVVVKEPLMPARICLIDGELEAMQNLVGGYIEPYPYNDDIDIYLNEEGKLIGLKPNLKIIHDNMIVDVIVGTVFFAKVDEEGNTVSLELDECFRILFEIENIAVNTEEEQRILSGYLERVL